MNDGVLSAIGNTPIVELRKLLGGRTVFAKLEMLNPTGSAKDRSAFAMIEAAFQSGQLKLGDTVIESSSGNMGLSLAMVCAQLGLRFICIVDERTSKQTIKMLRLYDAQVEVIVGRTNTSLLESRLGLVSQLLRDNPRYYWPNQYSNPANAFAHQKTMAEITEVVGKKIDFCFVATSTCGTLRGCVEFARNNDLNTKFIAVDAVGSVLFAGSKGGRKLPGHGISIVPALYESSLADGFFRCTDSDCIKGCLKLLRKEQIFAGASSGAIVTSLHALIQQIPSSARIVVILHDHGNRYVDTVYDREWAQRECGNNG